MRAPSAAVFPGRRASTLCTWAMNGAPSQSSVPCGGAECGSTSSPGTMMLERSTGGISLLLPRATNRRMSWFLARIVLRVSLHRVATPQQVVTGATRTALCGAMFHAP